MQHAIAELFGVSRSFVEKLLQRRRLTGEGAALPHGSGRRPLCEKMQAPRLQRGQAIRAARHFPPADSAGSVI